jgi:hypothetical protein
MKIGQRLGLGFASIPVLAIVITVIGVVRLQAVADGTPQRRRRALPG